MFNLGAFMEQIQKEIDALKRRLENTTYEGSARQGKIRAWANGLQLLVALEISPDLDKDNLANDILKACNAALRQAQEALNQELVRLTGGHIDFSSNNDWL